MDSAVADADLKDATDYQEAITQVKAMAVAALDQAFADSQADVLVSVNNYHSQVYATANYPAITVPLGKRANGMPVGVVLIGKPGKKRSCSRTPTRWSRQPSCASIRTSSRICRHGQASDT